MKEILQDKQVLVIQKESKDVVTRAENFQIISEESASTANKVLHWIAQKKKELEDRRKFFVQPLNDHVKRINAEFKEVTEPLEKADGIIRGKVIEWRAKIEMEIQKKNEELRKKAEKEREKQEKKAEAKGEVPPAPTPIPVVELPKSIDGVSTMKVWTYEILDIGKVPIDFMVLDSVAVIRAIRQGVRDIPGLRIFQKETIQVR